jgi:hypothetical protein
MKMAAALLRRKEIFQTIFIVISLLFVIQYYFGEPKALITVLNGWGGILFSWSFWFGSVALILSNVRRVNRRVKNWKWYAVVLVSFFFTFGMSFYNNEFYTLYITTYLIGRTLNVGMVAYVGIYALTVFTRGSRKMKSLDVVLMMFCIIMGLLLNAPITPLIWDQIPVFGEWLKNVPANAANTALLIGIALGTIAMYVRAALGEERAYLGG